MLVLLFAVIFIADTSGLVNATMARNVESIALGRGVTTGNTSYMRKINNSFVYAKCTGVSCENSQSSRKCRGFVQGSNDSTSSIGDPGKSPTYEFYDGVTHEMVNYVVEDGYNFARIHFTMGYNTAYTIFTFNWQPITEV